MSSEIEGLTEAQQHLQEHMMESVDELKTELTHQQAEEQKERSWLNKVALSTAILAALAAIAAMQGNSLANHAMMNQLKANDQWELYQAKATKRHVDQSGVLILQAIQKSVPNSVNDEIDKLKKEQEPIQRQAQAFQEKSRQDFEHHEYFAFSVAVLQIAISLGAMAALLKKRPIWYFSMALGLVGIILMMMGVFIPLPS